MMARIRRTESPQMRSQRAVSTSIPTGLHKIPESVTKGHARTASSRSVFEVSDTAAHHDTTTDPSAE